MEQVEYFIEVVGPQTNISEIVVNDNYEVSQIDITEQYAGIPDAALSDFVHKGAVNWNSVYSTVSSLSSFWNSVYNFVNATSSIEIDQEKVTSFVISNSSNILSVNSLVNLTSAQWNSVYAYVNANSSIEANQEAATAFVISNSSNLLLVDNFVFANSSFWFYQGTDIKALSSYWQEAYTNLVTNSAAYLTSIDISFLKVSANWDSVYTTVNQNSSLWFYQGTDLKALSANWQESYTNLVTYSAAYLNTLWDNISGKPLTFTPSTHTHPISAIDNLQTTLNGKASSSHTHNGTDIYILGTNIIVTGAGTTSYNTTYIPNGTNEGKTKYLASNGFEIKWVSGGPTAWYLYNNVGTPAYYNTTNSSTPAVGGWQIIYPYGNSPAPNVALSTVTLTDALTGKVDKETGKGLSTNDFTTAEKLKLSSIDLSLIQSTSAQWNIAYSYVISNSSIESTQQLATTFVLNNSSNILLVDSLVMSSSANWDYQGTDLKSLSSRWDSAYTNLVTNSAAYLTSVDISFLSVSSNWDSVYNTVNQNSATNWALQDLQSVTNRGASSTHIIQVPAIQFDTINIPGTVLEGQIQWNPTDGTMDLGMQGGVVIQQIGQELFVKVINKSGSTISNGTPVYFSGRQGNRPKILPSKGDSQTTSKVEGLTTQDIDDGDEGYITTFGYVRQIKTDYAGWNLGDKLYVSKTVSGGLTNINPQVPHHCDGIGEIAILGGHGIGAIFVNIERHVTLDSLSDVDGTPLTQDGQILVWHNTSGYFDFDKNINNYVLLSSTGNWDSVYSTVNQNSSVNWNYQGTDLKALSANWESASTLVQNNSSNWNVSYDRSTVFAANSANYCTKSLALAYAIAL